MILGGPIINWSWYCEFDLHSDNTVTIHKHYRLHNIRDYPHPKVEGGFKLIEDDERTVKAIEFGGKVYGVRNQKYIFSYGD